MDLIVLLLAILAVLIIALAVVSILIWHDRRIARLEKQRLNETHNQMLLQHISDLLEQLTNHSR